MNFTSNKIKLGFISLFIGIISFSQNETTSFGMENDVSKKEIVCYIFVNTISYNKKSSAIDSISKLELNKLVYLFKTFPEPIIEISSHTDCKGTEKENQLLSEKRTKTVFDYLIKEGVKPTRIVRSSYGEKTLIYENNCDTSVNNRTEFRIIGTINQVEFEHSLIGVIRSKLTGKVIKNVEVFLKNNITNTSHKFTTSEDGRFYYPTDSLANTLNFDIYISKHEYLFKKISLSKAIKNKGNTYLHNEIDLDLIPFSRCTFTTFCGQFENIYYTKKDTGLNKSAKIILDKLIKCLYEVPEMTIEIASYTDCRGSKKENLRISNSRAKKVINYVISKGISKGRIFGKGYGNYLILYNCDCKIENSCNEEEYNLNNITEFRVVH